jgi:hypothetical protein
MQQALVVVINIFGFSFHKKVQDRLGMLSTSLTTVVQGPVMPCLVIMTSFLNLLSVDKNNYFISWS